MRAYAVLPWLGWALVVLVPAVLTVLRDTTDYLNADAVQQSLQSIQGPKIFFWGQDRLFPFISWIASPVADPTANLWICLVLQATSLYGLLLVIAQRTAAATRDLSSVSVARSTLVHYLVLVAVVNGVLSGLMVYSYGIEGQPYALSWLLLGLAYQAWKRTGWWVYPVVAALCFVSLGVNPSTVLLAALLVVVEVLRHGRIVRWAGFLGVVVVMFVLWSYLQHRFAMYSTPDDTPNPSYFSFSLARFGQGLPTALQTTIVQLRPIRLLAMTLVALLALVLIPDAARARLVRWGAFFFAFTALFVSLFAGNNWVAINGYHYRYFFPLSLLIVLTLSVPTGVAAVVTVPAWLERQRSRRACRRDRRRSTGHVGGPAIWTVGFTAAVTALAAVLALAGPVHAPQDARIETASRATADYAKQHDIRFVSGDYWNVWPLMLLMLQRGRNSVFVAAVKSAGDRVEYRDVLDEQVRNHGSAKALCINQRVGVCAAYLDDWTRPGWRPLRGAGRCPTAPIFGPPSPEQSTKPVCRVLHYKPAGA